MKLPPASPSKPPRTRGNPVLRLTVLAFSVTLASQGSAHAEDQDLGRLFFTPERRAALDRQRHLNVEQARIVEGANLTVNGVVRRSGGKSTVWINGVAHDAQASDADLKSRIDRHDPSRVTIRADDEAPASLKVGESINRATRERQDVLDGGQIVVRGLPPRHKHYSESPHN